MNLVWEVEGIDKGRIAGDKFHFTLQAWKRSLLSFIVSNALESMAIGLSKSNMSHKIFEKFHPGFHSLIFLINSYHVHLAHSFNFFTNLSRSLNFL